MLKGLTRKVFTLVMLCAALMTVSSVPASSSKNVAWDCVRAIDRNGNCVIICCDDWGCTGTPCP